MEGRAKEDSFDLHTRADILYFPSLFSPYKIKNGINNLKYTGEIIL